MTTLVHSMLNGFSPFLHTIRTTIKAWMSLILVKIPLHILELAPLEHLKKLMDNVVTAPVFTFLIVSSSFLQVKRSIIKAWMGLKFGQIRPWTLG